MDQKIMLYLKNDHLYESNDMFGNYISFNDLVQISKDPFTICKNNIVSILNDCLHPRKGDKLRNFMMDKYVQCWTENSIMSCYDKITPNVHIIRKRKGAPFSYIVIDNITYYLFHAELSTSKLSINNIMDMDFTTIVSSEQLRHRSIIRFNSNIAERNDSVSHGIYADAIDKNEFEKLKRFDVDGVSIFVHPLGIMYSERNYSKKKLSI